MRALGMTADDTNPQWWMERHGPAALRAAERRRLEEQRLLAHDLAVWARAELRALPHLGGHGVRSTTFSAIREHVRAPTRCSTPSTCSASTTRRATRWTQARDVAHRPARRHETCGPPGVHQPAHARDAEPGDEPCLTRASSISAVALARRFLQGTAVTAGVVAVSPYLSQARGVRGAAGCRQPGHPRHDLPDRRQRRPQHGRSGRRSRRTPRCGPTLKIADGHSVGSGLALHPSLVKLKARFDQDEVAIVRGVGYKPPDLSHFSSSGIWMHGWGGSEPPTGWLGRYLDGLPNTVARGALRRRVARRRQPAPRGRGRRRLRRCR